ncbi:hypothetical protein CKM354_001298300 [Cercospora kikuchii]|uniref:Protein kinase domain-containing protein n=1 Tax=Cercospora kikuchii TaxID=84275 RepID=A0A9P3FN29_9PEZI|nr:uncharacterized protein CKM354_001298300 [Cercospora kikuchii]GIZ49967.1 hypothetical protein CKM354_001298300 [Cercospora kikuchii]
MTRRNAESGESAPQAATVYKYATSGLSLPEYRLKRPQLKYPAGYNDQDPVIKTDELKLLSRAPNLDVLEFGEKAVVCRFRIIDNNSGDDWLAVKIRPDKDDPDRNITLAEWRVLQSLDHNHIIATVGAYEKDQGRQGNQIGILLYPLAATSLEARIHSLSEDNQQAVPDEKREVNSKAMLEFLPCLCRAVIYLHQQGIEHHDIKAGNILFDRSDTVILADFDRATKSENDDLLVSQQSAIQDADTYAPDRVLDNHPLRNFKDDVSCLGIVFLEIATVILGETMENFNDCLRFEEHSKTLEEDRIVRWIEHLKNTVSQRPHKRLNRVDLWPLQLDLIFRMIKAGPDDEDVLRVACAQFSSLCEPCKHCSPEAGWSASSM